MRTMLLCGAILVVAACGRKQSRPPTEPAVDLPRRTTSAAVEPAGADSITITLAADGRVLAYGREWSLEQLDGMLTESVRPDAQRAWASTVARLRIDRAVPWLHVRWLAGVLAGHFVREIRFVYADSKLGEADLPCRISTTHVDLYEPTWVDVLRLRIVIDGEGHVRCGEPSGEDISALATWTAEATGRVGSQKLEGIRSDVVPRNGTAWGTVAAVYEHLRASDAANLTFAGGYRRPPAEVRRLARLPRPDPELAARAADGSHDNGGMDVQSVWPYVGPEFDLEWEPEEPEVPLEEPAPVVPDAPYTDR